MTDAKIRVPTPPPPTKATSILPKGKTIAGRYRIQASIGAGNMGMVYVAEHLQLRKKVAVKVLDTSLSDIPNAALRFQREAQATSRIDHPNVAAASDHGRLDDGTMYLVLEYIDGRSLRKEIETGPLPLARALPIAEQIASALSAAHALDIVHRDLKPENVMLVTNGATNDFVKVLDFGIARIPQPEEEGEPTAPLTRAGAVFGTPEYMAPEQAIGQRVDARADFYSLGVVLFEMIAGVRPYEAESPAALLARQLTAPIPTFADRVSGLEVPRAVERVVQRLLGKRPAERYQSIGDVIAALGALRHEGSGISGSAPPTPLPAFDIGTRLDLGKPPTDGTAQPERQQPAVLAPLPVPSVPPMPAASANVAAETDRAPAASTNGSSLGQRAARWTNDVLVPRTRATAKRAIEIVDARRAKLPKALQLSGVPSWVLLALAGFGLLAAVTGLCVAACHDEASFGTTAATSGSASALAEAPSASVAAPPIEAPKDEVSALLEQARDKLRGEKAAEAVALVTRVLAKNPDRRKDERVASILFEAAASPTRAAADASFSLLQGTMAGNGAEVLYWLSRDRGVPVATRRRAEQIVASEAFERNAPGSVKFAQQLRRADTCEKKRETLKLALEVGGEIVLDSLRELKTSTGCGLRGDADCYPCLRQDGKLDEAIARIERQGK